MQGTTSVTLILLMKLFASRYKSKLTMKSLVSLCVIIHFGFTSQLSDHILTGLASLWSRQMR